MLSYNIPIYNIYIYIYIYIYIISTGVRSQRGPEPPSCRGSGAAAGPGRHTASSGASRLGGTRKRSGGPFVGFSGTAFSSFRRAFVIYLLKLLDK